MIREPLDLKRCWTAPDPDSYGIGQRLTERKQSRLNGQTYVSGHIRRRGAA